MSPEPSPAPAWFQHVLFHSVQAGLCPLIPLPFVDDWALEWVRARMVRSILSRSELPATDEHVSLLAVHDEGGNVVGGALKAVVITPFKWIFRKTFIVLNVKRCADVCAAVFQQGLLLERSIELGYLSTDTLVSGSDAPDRVRQATREVCEALDPGPIYQIIERAFSSSKELLPQGARLLGRIVRRERQEDTSGTEAAEKEEKNLLSTILDKLTESLWYREDYLQELADKFRERMENPPQETLEDDK